MTAIMPVGSMIDYSRRGGSAEKRERLDIFTEIIRRDGMK